MKLVECVPNFSEGRDQKVLDQIANVIRSVKGVTLLDVDPGADTNRTVFTFVGEPKPVEDAAFLAIKKASELIDMSKHKGAHARMGATDVCPFIPVSNITMEECADIARALGKRVGEELEIPVYLYENAASTPERRNLADVRAGEYEALPEKMKDDYWKPDFGPQKFNAKSGATAISAREFLIAYNINLNTRDKKKAHDIALDIREKGRFARDENNKFVRDENGKKIRKNGLFTHCKAVGWYIDDYNRAQISINLTNYKITPPHLVLEKVREIATANGIAITGSELVGLLPKEALLNAGKFYLRRMNETCGIPERMILETAVQSMGLDDLSEFDLDSKVIEYAISNKDSLDNLTLKEFADELSTDSPAPGGGSVAALCLSLSGALSSMVANLTDGKKGYTKYTDEARIIAEQGQEIKDKSIALIDADTQSFYAMMDALRLPKNTDEEIAFKNQEIQRTTKEAILIPLATLELALDAVKLSAKIAKFGNVNALSDAGVAAVCANAAAKAAYLNVKINMGSIEDKQFITDIMTKSDELRAEIDKLAIETENDVAARV